MIDAPTSLPPFTGAVLAGGRSSRMGRDKALLPIGGRTLLEHQLATLREAGARPLLLSGRADRIYQALDAGVRFVPDPIDNSGPIAGLLACLESTASPHLAVLAVDLPDIPPTLFQQAMRKLPTELGWVPMIDGRFEPLAAVYPVACRTDFATAIDADQFALQPLLANWVQTGRFKVWEVPADQRQWFSNWNSPKDLPA